MQLPSGIERRLAALFVWVSSLLAMVSACGGSRTAAAPGAAEADAGAPTGDAGSPADSDAVIPTPTPGEPGPYADAICREPAGRTAMRGTVYYVAPDGDDSHDGQVGKPFATLAHAAKVAGPGNTVVVRGGTYALTRPEIIEVTATADAPLVILAAANEQPVFDGSQLTLPTPQNGIIELQRASHVIIEGLEIRNSDQNGLKLSECSHITVRQCRIHDTKRGALFSIADHVVVEDNEFWNGVLENKDGEHLRRRLGWASMVFSWNHGNGMPVRDLVYRGNHLHDSWGECLNLLLVDGALAEGNRIHDCWSVHIYNDHARNVRIDRNWIYDTGDRYRRPDTGRGFGIGISNEELGPYSVEILSERYVITNNVISGTGIGVHYWWPSNHLSLENTWRDIVIAHNVLHALDADVAIRFYKVIPTPVRQDGRAVRNLARSAPTGGLIRNNIVATSKPAVLDLQDKEAFTIDHNCWSAGPPNTGAGPGDRMGPPGFAASMPGSAPESYKIPADSPCARAAVPMAASTRDFSCAVRNTVTPSLGAHEP